VSKRSITIPQVLLEELNDASQDSSRDKKTAAHHQVIAMLEVGVSGIAVTQRPQPVTAIR
jgi:hypothetical protein